VATARAAVDEATFERAWKRGRELSREEAIEYAFADTNGPP
jgi:hypothetical protein